MTSAVLSKGQNTELPESSTGLDVLVTWVASEHELDASALLLDASGKVRGDWDFVFYNQPESREAAVRHLGGRTTEEGRQESLSIDLAAVPHDVVSIVIAGSSGAHPLEEYGKLGLQVQDSAGVLLGEFVTADASSERAYVFGEFYRRGEGWKLRAVGQGWDSGLAGLAHAYGVDVDDTDEDAAREAEVDASEPDPEVSVVDSVVVVEEPTLAAPSKPARGVRTKKPAPKKVVLPEFVMAGSDTWQPARLFSVAGVGSGDEQEKRATSTLVATMQAVRPFARAICARAGAPAGPFEGYLEVPFTKGEGKVIPDGVFRVSRAGKVWTCLLEVKTGSGKLYQEQLENYLDVARRQKYDVVLSISNDIPAAAGEVPVQVNKSKVTKVALRHISWSEVIHEARMVLAHGGIEDPLQAWVLSEFIRYVSHPKSGAAEFVDMGRHWVAVRESVTAGTLRPGDEKASSIANSWTALSRHLALRFTAELGVVVKHHLPRRFVGDAQSRNEHIVEGLAGKGSLSATLRIPDTAGDLHIEADLRTNKVSCSASVAAPDEGTSIKRVSWLLKQLKEAPSDVLVEAVFDDTSQVSCENLTTVRADPKSLTSGRDGMIGSFTLTQTSVLGSKRSAGASSFITTVTSAADSFYSTVLQPLKPWIPAAPEMPEQ